MRPIDADALMAVMYHEAFETDSDRQKWDSGCWIRYKMFEEHIANAPTVGEWIPVAEGLPPFGTKVLAWVENEDPRGRFNKPGVYIAALEDKEPEHDPEGKGNLWGIPGYDSVWTVWGWSYFAEPGVKAWMPLPEPYREEDEA